MTPISDPEFERWMAEIGDFEPLPRVAVGVSGGADSMALCLLLDRWARARGGAVLALTVDHQLRPEAAAEAASVARILTERGVSHAILTWEGPKPVSGVQAAAREARYRLLIARCAAEGLFHLAVAHHQEDQAETVLLRVGRGSGVDGLAGMASVRTLGTTRLIRPLLSTTRARLAETCRAAGVAWCDDPSNRSPAYARARMRSAETQAALAAIGVTTSGLADSAARAAAARDVLDAQTAALLAGVAIYPEGCAFWTPDGGAAWRRAPEEIAARAMARCLRTVGGGAYPPRRERLLGLCAYLRENLQNETRSARESGGRTLGGCCIIPRKGGMLVAREPIEATERVALRRGETVWWDRRFRVTWPSTAATDGDLVEIEALGAAEWSVLRRETQRLELPAIVGATLPAFQDNGRRRLASETFRCVFHPAEPLA